jgi:hypothetical protein
MEKISVVYPIGKFSPIKTYNDALIKEWITEIETLPNRFFICVKDLSDSDLDKPLRKGAWSIRQLVHHMADSHHHSYTRFKWTLTEPEPLIKAYDEVAWSVLGDSDAPVQLSLDHLSAVHGKWVYLLNRMNSEGFSKCFKHPDSVKFQNLFNTLGAYAWHGNHHLQQIKNALKNKEE